MGQLVGGDAVSGYCIAHLTQIHAGTAAPSGDSFCSGTAEAVAVKHPAAIAVAVLAQKILPRWLALGP